MSIKVRKIDALNYHEFDKPGKIEVTPSKSLTTQLDLALAYSPGVAEPCKEIADNPENVYRYTAKGNLVAVISNGTAVLGLGNIGALASKPVMEGKGVLFKKFAGIDVFDIEVNTEDPEEFINTVKQLEPTFGGINLEDIKAPESFYIETKLKEELNIPVMHDDQHGTAIISGAALLNALELVDKDIAKVKCVVMGAGTAAIACAQFYISLGMKQENIYMLDRHGVITTDRVEESERRYQFCIDPKLNILTLQDALNGADIFLGLSVGNIVSKDDLKLMAKNPIIFALANPEPEISYPDAMESRPDAIMATGRSDFPNQVNNVLGFPYIFRGALDVRATAINEEMKMAAAMAIAKLAKETVPDVVNIAYADTSLRFGAEYLIPKPLDPRLITTISTAVAKAAIDSGVATKTIDDWDKYQEELLSRVGQGQKLINRVMSKAKSEKKKIIFAEGNSYEVLKAAQSIREQGIGEPILLGVPDEINEMIEEHNLELSDCPIYNPRQEEKLTKEFGKILYEKRKRKGVTPYSGEKLMRDRNYFGAMMLEQGMGDALITGQTKDYPTSLVPALQVIGTKNKQATVAGLYVVNTKNRVFFFADTTVNINPSVDQNVQIVGLTANAVKDFGFEPRIALLSYSNFGSARGEEADKMRLATEKAKVAYPDLIIDGEIQANVAVNKKLLADNYSFSELTDKGANTLIFPDLSSGNIAYKLLEELGGAELIGPILMGMAKPVHILQLGSGVRQIINLAAVAAVDAQDSGLNPQ